MTRIIFHICTVFMIVTGIQSLAMAVQWQALNNTTRYNVAYDKQSIRLTPLGRLEIWFRFVPRGETERKLAALEYQDKRYRSHLEYYEIDCSDQTALLGLIDVMGTSQKRLKRLQGGIQPEQILPGSILDTAAQRICPIIDEVNLDSSESIEPKQTDVEAAINNSKINGDRLLQIEPLLKKANSKEATADTWKELGNIYFDTDQAEQAIKAYEHALALRPDDADALNDQGAMYRQTGDLQRALANFEKALTIDPYNLESLYNSGYILAFDLNNIPKALIKWRRYLDLESKSETARQVQTFVDQYGK